ncbi:MAG: hypothetical protein HC824_02470, partial [Synechococcales cyanobacterium RM1_1_8]|nr:hypothetical protein [Synechococcales cyanobacterium RM1_1_8]
AADLVGKGAVDDEREAVGEGRRALARGILAPCRRLRSGRASANVPVLPLRKGNRMHTPEMRAAQIDDIRRLPEQLAAARAVGITAPPIYMDSLAKYGAIARGDGDLYLRLPSASSLHRHENIWDHAPGAIVLEEAGGQVSDRHGHPLDFTSGIKMFNNVGIVASNGILHDGVLRALRS